MRVPRWSRLRVVRVGIVLGVVLALVGAAGWVVLGSSLLAVRSIDVAGVARLTPAQVLAAAAVHRETPLARVDLDAVASRVGDLPAVRAVEVTRNWPGTVQIVVQERVPAAVRRHGSSYRLVDRSGVAFAVVRKRPKGLPLVSGAGPAGLRATVDVLAAVPPAVRRALLEVRATSPENVSLRLTRKRTVVWGSPERGKRKAAVLSALMTRKASVYDVSAPDAPTTRR